MDKCMPPREFEGNTLERCDLDYDEDLLDNKNYIIYWHAFNYTKALKDPYRWAFQYQTPKEAKVYAKMST